MFQVRSLGEWLLGSRAFVGLWLMSLAYLLLDFFPQVESVEAIFTTSSFWLLWLVFGFLNSIAFGILSSSSSGHVQSLIREPILATAAVELLSTIGVYSLLQSFNIQLGGQKVVDLERLISGFRAGALRACVARKTTLERESLGLVAEKLREIYKKDLKGLREDYAQIMSLARLKTDRIRIDLNTLDSSDGLERETVLTGLIMRMVLTDAKGARRLLIKRRD